MINSKEGGQKKPRKKRIKMNRLGNAPINLEILHEDIQGLNLKVDRILRTLMGDNDMGQTGLVSKVQYHEKWIEKQKLVWAKVFGVAIGSGLFGGFIGQLIIKIVMK